MEYVDILQGEDMGGNCFGDMGFCNQEDKVQNYTDQMMHRTHAKKKMNGQQMQKIDLLVKEQCLQQTKYRGTGNLSSIC